MQSKNGDLSGLVRDLKKYTSKQILKKVKISKQESRKNWLEMVFEYHAKYNKRTKGIQLWTHENHAIQLNNHYHKRPLLRPFLIPHFYQDLFSRKISSPTIEVLQTCENND